MLRLMPVVFALCMFALAVTAQAQTIVPAEREPEFAKEDIFDRLTPLAPARAPENAAGEAPPEEFIAEEALPTSMRLRQLQALAPTTSPTPGEETLAPLYTSTPEGVSNASPAPLSPKLRAMLTPAEQVSGQPPTIPAHAAGAMTTLSAEELRTVIAHVASAFDQELGALQHGARWQGYLKLDELLTACRVGAATEAVEKLPAIAQRFATLSAKPEYQAVTKRNNFQTLHLALGEFLSLDDQREARKQLLGSASQLQRSLSSVGTGAQWVGFFELSALQRLAASPTPVSSRDLVHLQLLLARFEQAATDDKFAGVAKLEGFSATQDSLRNILGVPRRPAPRDIDLSSPAEVAADEFTVPDEATSQLAQASATVERLPLAVDALQLVAMGGKAYLQQPGDAAWQPIGKISPAPGNLLAARDESAQLALGDSFALQLAAQSTLSLAQRTIEGNATTELTLAQGSVKAIANGRSGGSGQMLNLVMGDYEMAVSGDDFAVEFRVEKADGRVVAIVHAGEAAVVNKATGDRAVVGTGREAVMLATGIALRAAPPRSADWWMTPGDRPRSARRSGSGFSQ